MSARRELATAVLLCLAGASLVLLGAGRAWTTVDLPAGPLTGGSVVPLPGSALVPGVRALGLVGLAGVVALAATRRTGRVVVGVLLLLGGAGVVAAALGPDLTAASLRSDQVAASGAVGPAAPVTTTAWPAVTALGGLVLALAGLLTVLRGRSWPALGARYEPPAGGAGRSGPPSAAGAPTERSLWEALDRGEDPTDTLGPSPVTRPTGEADRT